MINKTIIYFLILFMIIKLLIYVIYEIQNNYNAIYIQLLKILLLIIINYMEIFVRDVFNIKKYLQKKYIKE